MRNASVPSLRERVRTVHRATSWLQASQRPPISINSMGWKHSQALSRFVLRTTLGGDVLYPGAVSLTTKGNHIPRTLGADEVLGFSSLTSQAEPSLPLHIPS